MTNKPFKTIQKALSYWYLLTIIGVLFILLGIYVFSTPLASYLVLATLFSLSFLASGLSELTFAYGNRKQLDHWGWFLASGLVSTMVGVLLLTNPALSMVTLPLYVGFGVLFKSIVGISFALSLKDHGDEYQSLLWLGIGGVILSFILIWNPGIIGMTLVTITALIFILLGVVAVLFSLKLKKLHDLPGKIKDKLENQS
ncbi:uncharacterized membrane protein HdeD (DUF308 family) [Algoriphagus iocasae]|jgi:uncharacterized membrane protein HdeD (DUF308 family)|uniref:Uncharacterized membrane protein HdeD (DUF308 family) n=1 Tax=Algoriphagus iocasae TaxID=1836499 RepID=A0A841MDF4_9BACT|nr:DUF308 domain-containing protein [Algoriphagus iocasae]MBB6326092.1 uncharacterized membrane protein HdeD (DUF308 family) [Algoriphagus iocasae]